jgi:general secretion pathway protein G
MQKNRSAFTMIELVFVIVVLGILGSIAISKMAVTRDDAQIVKGRSQVSAIRNAIMLTRQQMMLQGQVGWLNKLDSIASASATSGALFDSNGTIQILDYPIYAKNENGHWQKSASNEYIFKVTNVDVKFTYTNGNFDCNHSVEMCKQLTE